VIQPGALPDDLVGGALRGAHRHLAIAGGGPAVRYRTDVSPFASVGLEPTPDSWAALATLSPAAAALVTASAPSPPAGWSVIRELPVLLMAGPEPIAAEPDPQTESLTAADVDQMLDLVARTEPGPSLPGTIELGGYVGIRRDGVLAAMAGRRLHPPGWIEVSAVCADPGYRGQGLGRRVTLEVMRGIHASNARSFLHVVPTNPAVRLYEALGFTVAREMLVTVVQRSAPSATIAAGL
jgi:ribosomal protein S18 acetylase RimI-like enzyme